MRKLLLSLMTGAALILAGPVLADAGHSHEHGSAEQEGAQAVSESPLAALENGQSAIVKAVESGQFESIHEATEGMTGAIAALKSNHAGDAAITGTLDQLAQVVHGLHVAGDEKNAEQLQSELKKLDGGIKLLKARLPKQTDDHAASDLPVGTGKINSVDADHHAVNITHDPIAALQWPGMTMDFAVAESVDLSGFKAGDSVEFTLKAGDNNQYSIVTIEAAHDHSHGQQ